MTSPENDEQRNGPAADTALELMKQLITLASGVLALSGTFIGKFRTDSPWLLAVLLAAWLALIASVLSGIETISAIVKSRLEPEHDWSTGRGRQTARISKYSFVLGLTLFAAFALLTLFTHPASTEHDKMELPANTGVGAIALPSAAQLGKPFGDTSQGDRENN